jgi:hypothetical protein
MNIDECESVIVDVVDVVEVVEVGFGNIRERNPALI